MAKQPRLEREIVIEQRRGSATPPYIQSKKPAEESAGFEFFSGLRAPGSRLRQSFALSTALDWAAASREVNL